MSERFYFFGELHRIVEEFDLTMLELKLYCKVANFGGRGLFARHEVIAGWLSCDAKTVTRKLARLAGLGLIERSDLGWRIVTGCVPHSDEGDQKITSGDQMITEGDRKSTKGDQTITSGDQKITDKVIKRSPSGDQTITPHTSIINTRSRSTREREDPPTHPPDVEDKFFISEEDPEVQSDSRWVNQGKRPLKKFPLIWLSVPELEAILEKYRRHDLSIEDQRDVFLGVEARLRMKTTLERQRVNPFNWLTGWALHEKLEEVIKQTRLSRLTQ